MFGDLISIGLPIVAIVSFLATAFGVALFRRYAARTGLLDHPNERSSHSSPVPRGGGVVIVLVCLGLYVASAHAIGFHASWWFVVGGGVVAGISWLDDKHTVPPLLRLFAQAGAAVLVIVGIGHFTSLPIPFSSNMLHLGWLGVLITFLWIVWMINAYNFMDGIDGIAGSQGVVAGISWAILGFLLGDPVITIVGAILAFSCLGFLVHNWSPARIFMGDVGSAFLGFSFAVLPVMTRSSNEEGSGWLLAAGVSFVWLFLFDTLFTLAARLKKGEKVWIAHRQHLYQRMVIAGTSHASVTLLFAGAGALVAASFLAHRSLGTGSYFILLISMVVTSTVVLFCGLRKKR
ncbi:MAG TPA: glycosyltransferase family 4 protein [Pyrinomonadaceae bacterium]|nr:glycosyltransferase family 4 protein [Pyrinomonadaceae bacterium]